jgi:DNA (cytosine-5)-methyltransferase 1
MRHGSLFSGIGGFDLAAEWMGWENIFHCEWNPFGQKVLHHYWPNAIQYNDITKTDFTIHRGSIDILTGGFPCQPYSAAGKRLGKEDERHLWPEMLRAIREIAPKYVVGENVLGLTNWNGGVVFDEVHSDLESAGYEVQAVVIPAAACNAPHGRDRVWFVARNTNFIQHDSERRIQKGQDIKPCGVCKDCLTADTEGEQGKWLRPEQREFSDTQQGQLGRSSSGLGDGLTADTDSDGQHRRNSEHEINTSEGRQYALGNAEQGNGNGDATDTESICIQGQRNRQREGEFRGSDWSRFPTQSPICGGDDGLPRELDGITFSKWRNESIKAYGNAVTPQVVYTIFKAIQEIDYLCNA